MASTSDRNDPYAAFSFQVNIDGITAGFSEVTGLENETDVIEYRTGLTIGGKQKVPGINKFPNIVLKRGLTKDQALWDWRKKVLDGKTERRNGTITLMDENQKPARTFTFYEGWPSKWNGPAFNAANSEVAIETLEIACEKIVLGE